jgi:nickel-dependent lactate racemase
MIDVRLAYGTSGLTVSLPADRTTVVTPLPQPAAPDAPAALRDALRAPVAGPPLRDLVRQNDSIAVSLCDITRPQPREAMIRALVDELDGIADRSAFTLLVATGTHRGNTGDELRQMLGEFAESMTVINHDGRDPEVLCWCGTMGNGVPVWLNRHWVDADVKVTTGFVEPHFFAGFSGGPKLVAPGLAGLETVLVLHDATRIGSPKATWGVCEGNPVHDDIRAIAQATGVDFALDVVLNDEQRIVSAFGGELFAMHAAAREAVRDLSMREVPYRYDIVVTTNAGYPLDQNLYQAVKGMSAAATIVKPGGLIICAAECRDGFPDHGSFREPLTSASSPAAMLRNIEERPHTVADQWQLQVLGRILTHARVGLYSTVMSADEIGSAHLTPIDDISRTVHEECARLGGDARVCVLPEGPQTIAYVTDAGPVPASR